MGFPRLKDVRYHGSFAIDPGGAKKLGSQSPQMRRLYVCQSEIECMNGPTDDGTST